MTPLEGPPHARDRGPAKYFHGRQRILANFSRECVHAATHSAGTIFLVQGAPGAGKTALLAECAKRAQAVGWRAARIDPDALWDPHALRKALGRWRKPAVTGKGRVGVPGVGTAEIATDQRPETTLDLLGRSRKPLLLVLDEAQHLGDDPPLAAETVATARRVLTRIHNGEVGRSVMLLAGGLGTSQTAFEKLGISRFEGDSLVNLGRLNPEAERAVLQDWLTKDGRAKGDVMPWIDAITKETHGWPQHILAYVKPALVQLHKDNGHLTAPGLDTVLRDGTARRITYYEGRAAGFMLEQLRCLTQALADSTPDDRVSYSAIMETLTRYYDKDEANRVFHHALHKGLLEEHRGAFATPIPSMRDWLVSEYGNRVHG